VWGSGSPSLKAACSRGGFFVFDAAVGPGTLKASPISGAGMWAKTYVAHGIFTEDSASYMCLRPQQIQQLNALGRLDKWIFWARLISGASPQLNVMYITFCVNICVACPNPSQTRMGS